MSGVPPRVANAFADRYDLEREVGSGGTATVYQALDRKHNRSVAIKVLRPEVADRLGPDRFVREIEIAASLTHPHILPLHDSGRRGGFLYYITPFIEGESLRSRLTREGALPLVDAVRVLRELADALAEAHDRGVIHRDIKPDNVLLTGEHAWVADFGLAKALEAADSEGALTTAGVAMGTPQYMAPEQAVADPHSDHRVDLFALGVVAYEMLTGISPFATGDVRTTLTAVLARVPEPPHEVRVGVPESLSRLVMSCLDKKPEARPQSARVFLDLLESAGAVGSTGATAASPPPRSGRPSFSIRWALAAGIVVAVGAGLLQWRQARSAELSARIDDLPRVLELLGSNRIAEAAQLAVRTRAVLGDAPELMAVWPRLTSPFLARTEPTGASVWMQPYDGGGAWELLGTTPIERDALPVGVYRFRIEADGYESEVRVRSLMPANQLVEVAASGMDYLQDPSYVLDVDLVPQGTGPGDQVLVKGGVYGTTPLIGFTSIQPALIPDFWIDRTEVTNAAYLEFVRAGGYADSTLWLDAIRSDPRGATWSEASSAFIDSTGRPGPASWSLGQPPSGAASLPVGGLSWFEASAYCRWRGSSLPTLYHWARATLPSSDVWIPFAPVLAAGSNLAGTDKLPVASTDGLGISGAHDLAGNVREWVTTASNDRRFLMGGGWSDPVYYVHDAFPEDPWQRTELNGVRCANFGDDGLPSALQAALDMPEQDYSIPPSLSDAEFAARTALHQYDRQRPLAAVVDSVRNLDWGAEREWVTIDAAGGQRMPIRLHIPLSGEPPFPAFIYFGGGNMIRSRHMEEPQPPLDELVRSGRVLVETTFDGTFSRNDGRTLERLVGAGRTELMANWVKDLGRTIDYLESRPDIDHTKVSYFGLSLGSAMGPRLLAFEPRFSAALLISGGFSPLHAQPSIQDIKGLSARIRTPILMMGGANDFNSPIEPHQQAFFDAFGTESENKRFVVFDSGHWPMPMSDVLREAVDFLDRHERAGREAGPS